MDPDWFEFKKNESNLRLFRFCLKHTVKLTKNKVGGIGQRTIVRWIPNPEVSGSKPVGGSKVNSVFHP